MVLNASGHSSRCWAVWPRRDTRRHRKTLTTGRLLGVLVLIGALAGAASAGPLIDPTLTSNLPEAPANLPGEVAGLRLLEAAKPAVGPPTVSWWDTLTPLGVGFGVSRFQSTQPRSVPPADLLGQQEFSITTLGLTVQSDSLWGGDGKERPLRPYVGLGPAVFITSLADITLRGSRGPYDLDVVQAGTVERVSAALGLQAQAGLRYSLSRAWSIFGEYRLSRPAYGLPGLDGDAGTSLGVHRFQGGLSIQFP